MKLDNLLNNVNVLEKINYENVEVGGIQFDSRKVKSGDIFVATIGSIDGHNFINDAVNNGAVAVVVEKNINTKVPTIVVDNSRIALSQLSKNMYLSACDRLNIIMVTGTNGKTSITYILQSIFKESGIKCAQIGTNGIFVDNKNLYYGLTTPDPTDLHYYLLQLYNMGVTHVIMEASAQAIYLDKLYGITPKAIILTNITNEHLDYFGTMDNYANTKLNYLNQNDCIKIINIDDPYAMRVVGHSVLTYGLINPSDTFAINISNSINGLNFCVNVMDEIIDIESKLSGLYNVYNILACITCAYALNCNLESIKNGIRNLTQISGRFNKFFLDLNRLVVVDFAHTPDGFEKVLSQIASLRHGKLIVVFGCVGYSDSAKRKLMGKVASKYADYVILTTDNLNFEDFEKVNSDIRLGLRVRYTEIYDRTKAVEFGFRLLDENATLVLLGKGCETSNLIRGIKVPYSDIDTVESCIEKYFNVSKGAKSEDNIV